MGCKPSGKVTDALAMHPCSAQYVLSQSCPVCLDCSATVEVVRSWSYRPQESPPLQGTREITSGGALGPPEPYNDWGYAAEAEEAVLEQWQQP